MQGCTYIHCKRAKNNVEAPCKFIFHALFQGAEHLIGGNDHMAGKLFQEFKKNFSKTYKDKDGKLCPLL